MELNRRSFITGVSGAVGLLALAPLEASGWKVERVIADTWGYNTWILSHSDGRKGYLYEPVGDADFHVSCSWRQGEISREPEWYLNLSRMEPEHVSPDRWSLKHDRWLNAKLSPGDYLFIIDREEPVRTLDLTVPHNSMLQTKENGIWS